METYGNFIQILAQNKMVLRCAVTSYRLAV